LEKKKKYKSSTEYLIPKKKKKKRVFVVSRMFREGNKAGLGAIGLLGTYIKANLLDMGLTINLHNVRVNKGTGSDAPTTDTDVPQTACTWKLEI